MGASRGRVICHVLVEAHQDGAHADDDGDAHLYRVRSRSVWNDLRAIARQTVAEFEDCSVDDEDDGLEHNVYATVMLHGVEKHMVGVWSWRVCGSTAKPALTDFAICNRELNHD